MKLFKSGPIPFILWAAAMAAFAILISMVTMYTKEQFTSQPARPQQNSTYAFVDAGAKNRANLVGRKNGFDGNLVDLKETQGHYFIDTFKNTARYKNSKYVGKIYHFVQHTHTDAGWIFTMNYYYNQIVETIINSGINYLHDHHKFSDKFTFTNYDFLRMYLQKYPSKEPKKFMHELFNNKTFEIINSAIAMPDQALPYFEDLINNMEYGREYGLKTFGKVSRHGWAIDNFGQSAFQARLYAELGYETLTTVRIPVKEKDTIRAYYNLDFMWGYKYPEYNLFTHVLPYHYTPPFPLAEMGEFKDDTITGLDWKLLDRIYRAYHFYLSKEYTIYKQRNVLVGMGDDFQYYDYDQAMKSNIKVYLTLKSNVKGLLKNATFVVSTVEEYFDAVKAENLTFDTLPPTDFVPHSSERGNLVEWWTGYFSVQPTLKYEIRTYSQFVRAISTLMAYQILQNGNFPSIYNWTYNAMEEVRFIQGILQHHDAITGTCTRQTAADYLDMARKGNAQANYLLKENMKDTLFKQLPSGFETKILHNGDIRSWNVEQLCIGYLPGVQPTTATLQLSKDMASRLKVKHSSFCYESTCLVNVDYIPGKLTSILSPKGSPGESQNSNQRTVPLQEGQKYAWTTSSAATDPKVKLQYTFSFSANRLSVTLNNGLTVYASIHFDGDAVLDFIGRNLYDEGVYSMQSFNSDPAVLDLCEGSVILHSDGSASVSAYNKDYHIFVALHVDPRYELWNITAKIIQGPVASSAINHFMVRYFVEEVASAFPKYKSDSNGFDMLDRQYDIRKRPEGNYYPLGKFIQIQGKEYQFTVSVDRGIGGTSPKPGVIEIMFNRALGIEDTYGVPERVVEDRTIIFEHKLILDKTGGHVHRKLQIAEDGYGLLVTAQGTAQSSCNGIPLDFPRPSDAKVEAAPKVTRPEHQYIKTFLDLAPDALKVRLYNLNDDLTITIDNVRDFIRERYNLSRQITIEERSLDYNQPISEILEQPYMWRNVTALKKAYAEETIGEKVVLKPLKMKTYKIIVDKPAK
jgi:hypothetical protein